MNLTKDLGNLPGNICTRATCRQVAGTGQAHNNIKTTVLEEKTCRSWAWLLPVRHARSEHPAKLITLEYSGADKKQKPVVLSARASPSTLRHLAETGRRHGRNEVHMSGAGSVLGTIQAIARWPETQRGRRDPDLREHAFRKATAPGHRHLDVRPDHRDPEHRCEGRLILCDALTYSAKFNPDTVIDIATLTGACVIALGNVVTACSPTTTSSRRMLKRRSRA